MRYGAFALDAEPDLRIAAALSVGGDRASPALAHKGNPDQPNEDAVLVRVVGDRVLLAVADGHFGIHASHSILRAIAGAEGVPGQPATLARLLGDVPLVTNPVTPDAGTTLTIAVLRRELRAGFGFTFGDSSCMLASAARSGAPCHAHGSAFVRPGTAEALDVSRAAFFEFDTRPGELVVLHTDGVDACCYGRPDRSPDGAARIALLEEHATASSYAEALMGLALAGLPDAAGGQDNIAIAVAEA